MTAEAARSDPETTEDALYGGQVRLRQPLRGHRAGTDAILLAALADARPGDRAMDLGSGTGAAGLALAARVALTRLVLLEREPALVRLAAENLALNGVSDRGAAIPFDAFDPPRPEDGLEGSADLVLTNPPFFHGGRAGRESPDPGRQSAHVMAGGDLAAWLGTAARLLAGGGRLALIHRADALTACLDALRPAFGSLSVRPIQPRPDADAIRIVISARRGGRGPLRLRPPLVLHGPDGRFTPEAAALHGLAPPH